MQDVLQNLAHIELLKFCKHNNIDPSNSYVEKARGYTYHLIKGDKGLVSVTFTKNSVPTFTMSNEVVLEIKSLNNKKTKTRNQLAQRAGL